MTNSAEPEKTPSRSRRFRPARLLWLLLIPAVLIPGLPRRWRVPARPEKQDLAALRRITDKLSAAVMSSGDTVTLTLTPPEVNALLNQALRAAQTGGNRPATFYYTAEWRRGAIEVRVSRPLGPLAVNLSAELLPDYRTGRLSVRSRRFFLGSLPLPARLSDFFLARMVERFSRKPEYTAFAAVFQRIECRNDGVTLQLQPCRSGLLLPLLLNR